MAEFIAATIVRAQRRGERHAGLGRPGFSLIEVVLAIALVGVLATLIVPMLGDARLRARFTTSTARIRQHATVFASYNNDHRDFMPYLTDPRATWSVLRAGDFACTIPYFMAKSAWHVGLADDYYAGSAFDPVFGFPGEPRGWSTPYFYSQAFLADPKYWNRLTRTGPDQWRATRAGEVLFPAHKALIVDSASEHLRSTPDTLNGSPVGIAFVDASAREVPKSAIRRGYFQETGWAWHGTWNTGSAVGMATIDGVRGRDVE